MFKHFALFVLCLLQYWGPSTTKGVMHIRKETFISSEYNLSVLNLQTYDKTVLMKVEVRGNNTTRSACHLWIPRAIGISWGPEKVIPKGCDVYVFMEKKFTRKYYTYLCAQKLKKCLKQPVDRKGVRKMQVYPYEIVPIQMMIHQHTKNKHLRRRLTRSAIVKGGILDPPLHIVAKAADRMDNITIVAKKDLAVLNWQKYLCVRWSLILNCVKKKINFITCEIDPSISWKCKPAVLDGVTERNGFRDINNEYVLFV